MFCIGLEDMMELINQNFDDKAPSMRIQVFKFLKNFVGKKEQKVMTLLRNLVDKIVRLTEDGNEGVRKEALDFLCLLKSSYGMRYFG